jgi:hypothetical protein
MFPQNGSPLPTSPFLRSHQFHRSVSHFPHHSHPPTPLASASAGSKRRSAWVGLRRSGSVNVNERRTQEPPSPPVIATLKKTDNEDSGQRRRGGVSSASCGYGYAHSPPSAAPSPPFMLFLFIIYINPLLEHPYYT